MSTGQVTPPSDSISTLLYQSEGSSDAAANTAVLGKSLAAETDSSSLLSNLPAAGSSSALAELPAGSAELISQFIDTLTRLISGLIEEVINTFLKQTPSAESSNAEKSAAPSQTASSQSAAPSTAAQAAELLDSTASTLSSKASTSSPAEATASSETDPAGSASSSTQTAAAKAVSASSTAASKKTPLEAVVDDKSKITVITDDGYQLKFEGKDEAWTITGPTDKTTRIWGDPHVTESDGDIWDFQERATFLFGDNKVTVEVDPQANMTALTAKVSVYHDDQRVTVAGIEKNKPFIAASANDASLHDASLADGVTYKLGTEKTSKDEQWTKQ